MSNIESGQPIRTLADGADERVQIKIVGNATLVDPTNELAVAEYQAIVDSDGNVHDLAHGHDSAGVSHPILTDTNGRIITVLADDTDGANVHDNSTASAVAKNVSATHNGATVAVSKVFKLKAVHCAATGSSWFEIKIGVPASEVSKHWVFLSASNPNGAFRLQEPIDVPAGSRVQVIKTNKENQAMDLHDLIEGVTVDA